MHGSARSSPDSSDSNSLRARARGVDAVRELAHAGRKLDSHKELPFARVVVAAAKLGPSQDFHPHAAESQR